jgi:hypothetical protein
MSKSSELAITFAPLALLGAAIYDVTGNKTELNETYKVDKITHSDMLGIKMDTIYASSQNGESNKFVVDTGTTNIQAGECFNATVTGYYTHEFSSRLGFNNDYPTESVSVIECPSNP